MHDQQHLKIASNLVSVIVPAHITYEDGPGIVSRNDSTYNSDAGIHPKRKQKVNKS
jgi:hypothetical protein